jgi:hypothetical protein
MFMVFDGRWKLIHFEGGFRPILFDLETDPNEFSDLGAQEEYRKQVARLYEFLAQWGRRMAQRVTISDEEIRYARGSSMRRGILPFLIDGTEVLPELTEAYRGPARQIHAGNRKAEVDSHDD